MASNTTTPNIPLTIEVNAGDTAWVLISTALVFLMIPGVGYFYSGMARSKNALSLMFLSFVSVAIISIEWFMLGFSLSFSDTGSFFIGNFKHAFFLEVESKPLSVAPTIPANVFAMYQCMFASIAPALAFGGAAERSRILPSIVFLIFWSMAVYNFIAYWTWAPNGWARVLGALDYAGGTPVHIASGMSGLAYAARLGKRQGYGEDMFKPHSYFNILLGTALLWFGWFGFNPGSAGAANSRAGEALLVTNLSAATAAVTWMLWAWWRYGRKWSSFHFCSGAVAGLVAITPASGFVRPWAAFIIGLLSGTVCHFSAELKHQWGFDDALDVFAVHAVGGFLGCILTGVFADKSVAMMDNTVIPGGWINGNWIQVPIQLAGSLAGAAWSFLMTYLLLLVMNMIPSLRLRLKEEDEVMGIDVSQMGEHEYDHILRTIETEKSKAASEENSIL